MSSDHVLETCEICGQEGFVGEAEVRTHMLLDHEENVGACPLCDLAHVTTEELALHMNTAHLDILSPAQHPKAGRHVIPRELLQPAIPIETEEGSSIAGEVPYSSRDAVVVADEVHMNTAHPKILGEPQHPNTSIYSPVTERIENAKHFPDSGHVVLEANEVFEEDFLIYIEDHFAEPTGSLLPNGTGNDIRMSCSNGDAMNGVSMHVEDADVAMENGSERLSSVDVEKIQLEMDGEMSLDQSFNDGSTEQSFNHASGISQDLFDDSVEPIIITNGDDVRLQEGTECTLVDESRENLKEKKVIKLTAGRAGTDDEEQQDGKQNGRKRGRKEPDVRPKSTARLPPGEMQGSQQSLETTTSSRSDSESIKSETSSPFRKLFRTLTGTRDDEQKAADEDKKDKSGIWVDLTNDSEPNLLEDDAFMIIEDALPADEEEWEIDMPSTSKSALHSTSTPSKPKRKVSFAASPKIERHKKPEKQTLLSLSKQSRNVQSPVLCPLCGLGSFDPDFITKHINDEHAEGAVGGAGGVASADRTTESGAAVGGGDIICPVCGLSGMNAEEMNVHVELHFTGDVEQRSATNMEQAGASTSHAAFSEMEEVDRKLAEQLARDEKEAQRKKEEEEFKKLQEKYGSDGKGDLRRQSERNTSKAVYRGAMTPFEYHQQRLELKESLATGVDSGQTRTKDIIAKLANYYSGKVHNVSYARISMDVDHFSASHGDSGWGCGYRNIQMMLSALVRDPTFKEVVFNGREDIPSIPRLQLLIEDAWSKGFDAQGKEQLSGKVHNTRKWIGATEVVAMLSSLRIKCKLFDFHAPSGPNGTHPRLFAWIRDYFGKPSLFSKESSARSNKLPLYLQHEGHSRTVVGCDVLQDKSIRILLFDPSLGTAEANTIRRGELNGQMLKPLRKTLSQMKSRQYQIVCVEGLVSSDKEYQRSKILTSQRIT